MTTRAPDAAALEAARAALASAGRIAVLTGAGASVASGLPTFRGAGGLYEGERVEDLASPAGYRRDPGRVWGWYAARFEAAAAAGPNDAHRLLAELERRTPTVLVTQNVDGLHARAGSSAPIELHGSLARARCEACGRRFGLEPGFAPPPRCPDCGERARPDVVWFGEPLPEGALAEAWDAFASCDVALVVGTSGRVEPAASLARMASARGAFVVVIDPAETALDAWADAVLRVGAGEGLRGLLEGPPDDGGGGIRP